MPLMFVVLPKLSQMSIRYIYGGQKLSGLLKGRCAACNSKHTHTYIYIYININSREEIGGYCPHRRKWLLANIEVVKKEKRKEIAKKKAENKAKKKEG